MTFTRNEASLIVTSLQFLDTFSPTATSTAIKPIIAKIKEQQMTENVSNDAALSLIREIDRLVKTTDGNKDINYDLRRFRSKMRIALNITVCDDCGENCCGDDVTEIGEIVVCQCCEKRQRAQPRVGPTSMTDDSPVFMRDLPIELD